MDRSKLIYLLSLAIMITSISKCFSQIANPDLPNIVFIMADDMGYGDPSCYNPDSKIPTPNIDRLAQQGMRFTNAHSPGALCVPSRYGLLTGRYPIHPGYRQKNLKMRSSLVCMAILC